MALDRLSGGCADDLRPDSNIAANWTDQRIPGPVLVTSLYSER